MTARQWTPEQRVQQSAKIRQWRPWDKSTGPVTPEGKAVVARNGYKGGLRPKVRALCKLLTHQMNAELSLMKADIDKTAR